MIRFFHALAAASLLTACGQADSDGFLSDHNICNADTSALSADAVVGETLRVVTPMTIDEQTTFGQKLAVFEDNTDLYGIAVRLAADVVPTGDLELELWSKLDKELAYGQTVETVTPDGDQGIVLAKAYVTPSMVAVGEAAWVSVAFEEMTSVFSRGRYFLMFKPASGDQPKASLSAGSGLSTYDSVLQTWTISTTEHAAYQVVPCL